MKILNIMAIEAMDSRGMPTVMAIVTTARGDFRAVVPSGASVGKYEAHELRDGGARLRGKGVLKAVKNINTVVRERLCAQELTSPGDVDALLLTLDHTPNKNVIGANAMLAVSIASMRAFAAESGRELYTMFGEHFRMPCPMMNILNGGVHADNGLDLQEFMILPTGARDFPEALDMGREVYFCLKDLLHTRGYSGNVGDEGGFAPNLNSHEQALDLIMRAIERAGLGNGEISLGLDAAAGEWAQQGRYRMPKCGREYSAEMLIEYYCRLARDYPIVSLEDGLAEDDFAGFRAMKKALNVQIVGDDLFATNAERIRTAADCATAVLIKPNQIGTISETLTAMEEARRAGCAQILSHRSGDTEDPFPADFAVGTGCGLIKTGAPARAERTAKYNRLLELSARLKHSAPYAGKSALRLPKMHGFSEISGSNT